MVFMEKVNFIKMHGLGNDFVILDARTQGFSDLNDISAKLADRRLGIGCDQVIVLENTPKADVRMGIYNSDGSRAGMCGNAARCVADIILNEKQADKISIEIGSRIVSCACAGEGMVAVDMGEPILPQISSASPHAGEDNFLLVDVGNPHCVFFVDDAEHYPVAGVGPMVESHPMFPDRTNVEFVTVNDRSNVRMRVWERGCGVTFACGSGACATGVAAIQKGYTDRTVTVHMDGGPLTIEWREADNHITMTGPVAYVFKGEFLLSSDAARMVGPL